MRVEILNLSVAPFLNFNREQLLLIVPLVDRRIQIQTFVTLEPDQFCLQHGSQYLGGLRFSYPRVPLDQERFPKPDEQIDGRGQRPIRDVSQSPESVNYVFYITDLRSHGREPKPS